MAVHQHANFPRYLAPLEYAKKYGIKKRIYHSHNANDMYPSKSVAINVKKAIQEYSTIGKIDKVATHKWACSEAAGHYMFREDTDFSVIPDAIDAQKFRYNEEIRNSKRRELGLGESLVVGFVGRLQYQKNPEFLIEIFNEIVRLRPNSKLIIIGKGNLEEILIKMCYERGLTQKVLFLGYRPDISELMQSFDCMVMPSRFEGLGISYIEAQASGLPTFGSDQVPQEAVVTNLMHRISLERPAHYWAEEICRAVTTQKRTDTYSKIKESGYDVVDLAHKLQKFYLN